MLARLTDFQIAELYLKPAADRAAEFDRRARPGAAADVPATEPGGLPTEAAFVASMTAAYGPSPDYPVAWARMRAEAEGG